MIIDVQLLVMSGQVWKELSPAFQATYLSRGTGSQPHTTEVTYEAQDAASSLVITAAGPMHTQRTPDSARGAPLGSCSSMVVSAATPPPSECPEGGRREAAGMLGSQSQAGKRPGALCTLAGSTWAAPSGQVFAC